MHFTRFGLYVLSILLGSLVGIMAWGLRSISSSLRLDIDAVLVYCTHHQIPPMPVSILLTTMLILFAWLLVKNVSPEAAGSGVQEIEGALLHQREICWYRLIPVKFFGGIAVLASQMLLGREGPTIQLGGNCGAMFGDWCRLDREQKDCLIAAGAAAGLSAAFFAPLAGIIFVLEEMRNQFSYSVLKFKIVFMSCVMATVVLYIISGTWPAFVMPIFALPDFQSLLTFFVLGILVGVFGWIFNVCTLKSVDYFANLSTFGQLIGIVILGGLIGSINGVMPDLTGEGFRLIEDVLYHIYSIKVLFLFAIVRFILGCMCYGVGVPGGIFSPLLALGTLLGLLGFHVLNDIAHVNGLEPGMFVVAGMGALLASTVQAPVTGIVLVIEITHNYSLGLPVMVCCMGATLVAQIQNNPPIYHQLLKRILNRQQATNFES